MGLAVGCTWALNGKKVAIKKLKGYSCNQKAAFVKAYEKFVSVQSHTKTVTVLGLCPNTGCILLEFCEKQIRDHKIHMLGDLMRLYGDNIPLDMKVLALTDIIEGVEFLYHHNIIHGDIKPSQALVNGITIQENDLCSDSDQNVGETIRLDFDQDVGKADHDHDTRATPFIPPTPCPMQPHSPLQSPNYHQNHNCYKKIQVEVIEALQCGKDVIIVQPTGLGKSLCYVAPALLNPGKVTLVIEPVVAIIKIKCKVCYQKVLTQLH